ncbi:MAG: AAA family ATPase [Nitratireductor sp.]|nr:AAA family ATPase [Nitratireductor sp.]
MITEVNRSASHAGRQAYVIVCGNEKGGSGKTTTAMHVIVHLLNLGHTVASIDLDARQLSLTRYLENRRAWAARKRLPVVQPRHDFLVSGTGDSIFGNESEELERFSEIVRRVETEYDFIVIDTPGHDSYLMRLAHSMADTLITPLNDSYVDFDVLGRVDAETGEVVRISHYAQMVRDARRQRHSVDNALMDWVVVRNRLSHLASRNQNSVNESLKNLSMQLGCRLANGISERVIFRELFPTGLTALDELSAETLDAQPSLSHLAGRQEVRALVATLRLPVDAVSRRRAQARRDWMRAPDVAAQQLRIFAD